MGVKHRLNAKYYRVNKGESGGKTFSINFIHVIIFSASQ